jgi:hypothetical protein
MIEKGNVMSKLDWGLAAIVILGILISLFGPQKKSEVGRQDQSKGHIQNAVLSVIEKSKDLSQNICI